MRNVIDVLTIWLAPSSGDACCSSSLCRIDACLRRGNEPERPNTQGFCLAPYPPPHPPHWPCPVGRLLCATMLQAPPCAAEVRLTPRSAFDSSVCSAVQPLDHRGKRASACRYACIVFAAGKGRFLAPARLRCMLSDDAFSDRSSRPGSIPQVHEFKGLLNHCRLIA